MNNSLHQLIQAVARAENEKDLRCQLMDAMGDVFSVQRWGIYLMQTESGLHQVDVHGVSDNFVESYEKFGRNVDPVLDYVLNYHAPAHEEIVLTPGSWKKSDLYEYCCGYYDHEHIMTGPIVGNGALIGTIHFARIENTPGFTFSELCHLGALCMHVSSRLAIFRNPQINYVCSSKVSLTPREKEIINLVAKGYTNARIAQTLWIQENSVKQALKRLFQKHQVRNRAELVAKCID